MLLTLIVFFTLLGSICSVGFAGLLLLLQGRRLRLVTDSLIPYAIGTLLGAAFFGMIPHALLRMESSSVLPTILAGIILGAIMTYFLLPFIQASVPYLLSLSAASFIYIALADLVPGRRAAGGLLSLAWELPLIALGIGTIIALKLSSAH